MSSRCLCLIYRVGRIWILVLCEDEVLSSVNVYSSVLRLERLKNLEGSQLSLKFGKLSEERLETDL